MNEISDLRKDQHSRGPLSWAEAPVSTFTFYDLSLIWLGTTSLAIMVLIFAEAFTAIRALALGSILPIFLIPTCKKNQFFRASSMDIWLAGFLLVALFLRSNVSMNYMAGQDQGLYVAFSGIINKFHGAYYSDTFRADLPVALQVFYDQSVMAGIKPVLDGMHFYSSFYPLHPGWMALVSAMFGADSHTWSVVLFSLFAVSGAYFLAFELVGANDRIAARIAALLMAVNPVLCFFAKFPLSESQSSALTLNGLYLLAKALKSKNQTQLLMLAGSFLLFVAQVFTRQNFVIFLPPALVLYIASYSSRTEPRTGIRVRIFLWSLCAAVVIAGWIYKTMLPDLYFGTLDVYWSLLVQHPLVAACSVFILLASVCALSINPIRSRLQAWLELALTLGQQTLPWLPLLLLCASIPSMIAVMKTGALYNEMNGEAGLAAVRYHLVYRWLLAVTPAIWLLLILSPPLESSGRRVALPLILLCSAWIATQLYTGGTLPYLYYHMRFLASEIIPLSIIIAALVLDAMWKSKTWRRPIAVVILASTILFSLPFSFLQLRKEEGEDAAFFHSVDKALGSRDVLVAFEHEMDHRLSVPLRYYFGKQLFIIPQSAGIENIEGTRAILQYLIENIGSKYGTISLISTQQPEALPLIRLSLQTVFQFSNTFISNSEHWSEGGEGRLRSQKLGRMILPVQWISKNKVDYKLYRVQGFRETFVRLGCPIGFSSKGQSSSYVDKGWSGSEATSRWTEGSEATLLFRLAPGDLELRKLRINLAAVPFDSEEPVQLFLDGRPVSDFQVRSSQRDYIFTTDLLSGDTSSSHELRFVLPGAHSPKSIGMSEDPRLLGISVSTLTFDDAENPRKQTCDNR